jgi:hypothetical protein
MSDNRYNQKEHAVIQTTFTIGEEVRILTQDAQDTRIMNIRVFRVAPSRNGHVGFTKKGFYLTESEALELRDKLNELLHEDNISTLFDKVDTKMTPVPETLKRGGV